MSQLDQNTPFATMAELWTQSAKVYTKAVQTFVDDAIALLARVTTLSQ